MNREPAPVFVERAPRFDLALVVHYRARGAATTETAWDKGHTLDMSRTGLLFTGRGAALSCGDRIDFRIRLPAIRGPCGSEISGTGRVVRIGPCRSGGDRTAIAVTIERYKLAPACES